MMPHPDIPVPYTLTPKAHAVLAGPLSAATELAWPDTGPGYEWYREAVLAEAEEAPAILPAPMLTIVAAPRPARCRRCRYLRTWCCCPGGVR